MCVRDFKRTFDYENVECAMVIVFSDSISKTHSLDILQALEGLISRNANDFLRRFVIGDETDLLLYTRDEKTVNIVDYQGRMVSEKVYVRIIMIDYLDAGKTINVGILQRLNAQCDGEIAGIMAPIDSSPTSPDLTPYFFLFQNLEKIV